MTRASIATSTPNFSASARPTSRPASTAASALRFVRFRPTARPSHGGCRGTPSWACATSFSPARSCGLATAASECTESCPTQADPASFMAAARRYAVASYDRTHLAYLLATSRVFAGVFVVALVGLLAAFMYSVHRPADGSTLAFFEFIPSDFVHNLGVVAMAVMGTAALIGLFEMVRRVLRRPRPGAPKATLRKGAEAAVYAVGTEALAQRRFPQGLRRRHRSHGPGIRSAGSSHFATMWGSSACLAPTMLDYGLELLGVKARPARRCRSGIRSGCWAL